MRGGRYPETFKGHYLASPTAAARDVTSVTFKLKDYYWVFLVVEEEFVEIYF